MPGGFLGVNVRDMRGMKHGRHKSEEKRMENKFCVHFHPLKTVDVEK